MQQMVFALFGRLRVPSLARISLTKLSAFAKCPGIFQGGKGWACGMLAPNELRAVGCLWVHV